MEVVMDKTIKVLQFLLTRNQVEAYDEAIALLKCNKAIVEMKYENKKLLKYFERFLNYIIFSKIKL